jgi:ribose transport system permease protein
MMKKLFSRVGGAYMALFALLAVCSLANEHFRSPQNLLNIAGQVSYSGIIALGMTLVIAAGGIDLSVGALLALSGVTAVLTMNAVEIAWPLQIALGVAAAVAVGTAGGMVNGALVTLGKLPPFIVTVGTLSIFQSLAKHCSNAATLTVRGGALDEALGGAVPLVCFFGLAAALALLMRKTPFGSRVCAVGSNEQVARYAAIRTGRIKFQTYSIVGALSGLSAILYVGNLNSISSSAGSLYELDAIAAVIIGGTPMSGGRAAVGGTLAGVLILGVIANILNMCDLSNNLQGVVKGLVIIVAVLIQRRKRFN